jgi:hypothetical protein
MYNIFALPRSGHNFIIDCLNLRHPSLVDLEGGRGRWTLFDRLDKSKIDNKNIIIQRDLYNWLSSFLTHRKRISTIENKKIHNLHKEACIQSWYELSLECLRYTSYIKDPFIIKYNTFVSDENYKKSIYKHFNVEYNNMFLKVAAHGGGSSFDRMKYNGQASDMSTMNRYDQIDADVRKEIEQLVMTNKMLTDINNKLFPGFENGK